MLITGDQVTRRRLLQAILLLAAVALPCILLYLSTTPSTWSLLSNPSPPSLSTTPSTTWSLLSPNPSPPSLNTTPSTTWSLLSPNPSPPSLNTTPSTTWSLISPNPSPPSPSSSSQDLRKVLKAAAMADKKTVILTTVNSAWISLGSVVDLFMESFKVGNGTNELLDHLVVVAMDEKGYVRCMEVHKHCFALTTEGVDFSEQKNFMSGDYLKMMWRRLEFLGSVIQLGFDFIFSDTDIMWFRNPLPHFYEDGDFQIACDHFVGNPNDLNNRPNGGYMYVKSNNKTINFFKYWFKSKERYPGFNEQDVLNLIKKNTFTRESGIKMRFLDTTYFGGFCEPSKDFNKVCTMHANCCIGLERKKHDLRLMLNDWRRYIFMSPEERQSRKMSWSAPKKCSLAH